MSLDYFNYYYLYKKYKEIEPFLHNKRFMNYFMLAALFASILLILLFLKSLLVVAILLALNAGLSFVIRPMKYLFSGIEIVMLSTVLCAVAYGAKAGAIVGFLSVAVNFIFLQKFNPINAVIPPLYLIIGYLAGISSASITAIGITAVILYNIFAFFLIMFVYSGNFVRAFIFNFVNIAFNVFIFTRIAPILLKVVG